MTFKRTIRNFVLPIAVTGALALSYIGCANKTDNKQEEKLPEVPQLTSIVDWDTYSDETASASGDFNNDGNLDFVVTARQAGTKTKTYMFLGNGHGKFSEAKTVVDWNTYSDNTSVASGDFNNDKNLDFVVTARQAGNKTKTYLFLGDGHGNFRNQ